jgi:RNA polymerase sigma-70 factor (ECF subfamily)
MDLLQDATLQAYKGFETFQRGSNFRAWFLRVLTNRFLKNKGRKVIETLPLDDAEDIYLYRKSQELGEEGNSPDPAGLLIDRLDVEAVEDALDRLPDEYRTVAVMYFMNDFSYEEIADVLEIPIGTVRSRLHRARKLLQKALWDVGVSRGIVKEATSGV